jgi:uncharacterized membrane protein YsdA (DUF1294 family)
MILLALALAWNLATWAVYRLDKARARRGQRRIAERVLLGMAAIGGTAGALVAVYAHRHRHKASKRRFVAWLWAIVAAQIAAAAIYLV